MHLKLHTYESRGKQGFKQSFNIHRRTKEMKHSLDVAKSESSKKQKTSAVDESDEGYSFFKNLSKEIGLLKERKSQLHANYYEIFKLTGKDVTAKDFDMDGDNDLLDISFAGKIVKGIKRSILTKPPFGWNKFSCLFHKHWEDFHPRDKKGRIYIDIELDWIKPLFEYMKYCENPIRSVEISPSYDKAFYHIFNYFDLDHVFTEENLASSDYTDYPLTGSGVGFGDPMMKRLLEKLSSLEDEWSDSGKHWSKLGYNRSHVRKLFTLPPESHNPTYKKEDLRGSQLVLVIEAEGHSPFIVVTDVHCLYDRKKVNCNDYYGTYLVWDDDHSSYYCERIAPKEMVLSVFNWDHVKNEKKLKKEISTIVNRCSKTRKSLWNNGEIPQQMEDYQNLELFPLILLKKCHGNYKVVCVIHENGKMFLDEDNAQSSQSDSDHDDDEVVCVSDSNKQKMIYFQRIEIYEIEHFHFMNHLISKGNTGTDIKLILNLNMKNKYDPFYQETAQQTEVFLQKVKQEKVMIDEKPEKEFDFMKTYFSQVHDFESKSTNNHDVLTFFRELWSELKCTSQTISSSPSSLLWKSMTNPIVLFKFRDDNEENPTIFPILRSTIFRLVPDSKLAFRTSGIWEKFLKVKDKGDMDKSVDLILSTVCHPEAFKDILSSLRINVLAGSTSFDKIYVHDNSRYYIDSTLDYLGITPNQILKIS
jgi:hypothetical protein